MLILGDSTFAMLANMSPRIFVALLKKSDSVKCNLVAEMGEGGRCHGGDQRHVD